jgi:hypothetical protein
MMMMMIIIIIIIIITTDSVHISVAPVSSSEHTALHCTTARRSADLSYSATEA